MLWEFDQFQCRNLLLQKKKKNEEEGEDERKTFTFDAIDGKGNITIFSVVGHMWNETYQQLEMDKVYLFKNIKIRPVANCDPQDLDIYEYIIDDNSVAEMIETEQNFANNNAISFHTLSEIKTLNTGKTISKSHFLKYIVPLTLKYFTTNGNLI